MWVIWIMILAPCLCIVAASKLAGELLKAMTQLSPGTKRQFLDALPSNVLAEPELPVEDEPDVFNHGTSLDNQNE